MLRCTAGRRSGRIKPKYGQNAVVLHKVCISADWRLIPSWLDPNSHSPYHLFSQNRFFICLVVHLHQSINSQLDSQFISPMYNHNQSHLCVGLLIISTLVISSTSFQMLLTKPKTCLGFETEDDGDKLLFTYHHNPNMGTANLLIYDDAGNLLAQSGSGVDHQTYLEVVMPRRGEGKACFQKEGKNSLEVHFDVIHEDQQLGHAGKEDISKLTRRVGEFLVEIKKTSLEYKQVLAQHNARQERLKDYEDQNMIFYVIKVGVMMLVLGVQLWAVRKIFE